MTPTDTTEVDIDEADSTRCAHGPCACDAGETGFCSVLCESEGEAAEEAGEEAGDEVASCGCGHADCPAADIAATAIRS